MLADACLLTVPGPFLRIASSAHGLWLDQLEITVAPQQRPDDAHGSSPEGAAAVVEAETQPLWITGVHWQGEGSALEALRLRRSHTYAAGALDPGSWDHGNQSAAAECTG